MTLSAVAVGRGWAGAGDQALGSGGFSGLVWGSSLSQGLSDFAAGGGGIVVEVGVCGVAGSRRSLAPDGVRCMMRVPG